MGILSEIDSIKRVAGRNLRDFVTNPRSALERIADAIAADRDYKQAVVDSEGLRMRPLTKEERSQARLDQGMNIGGGGALGIIKGKGGNWLSGSVEDALKGLKRRVPTEGVNGHTVDDIARAQSLNSWVEGPLTKYVKRDMATEGDPVRRLAEQGILHTQPDMTRMRGMSSARKLTGFESQPVLTRPESQYWNNMADYAVTANPVEKFSMPGWKELQEPWMEKLPSRSQIYEPGGYGFDELGFSHLTDELYNALRVDSDLPRNLRLTPEQMQQLGMEKAVRHVADINAWRAAQKAEADLARAQNPATHVFKEYGEDFGPNPKGLRWVELKAGSDDFTGMKPVIQHPGVYETPQGGLVGGPYGSPSEKALRDALKYEGDTMGHCVGGYCDDVLSGRSRIYSLRDAKGQPHVTIETRPPKSPYPSSGAEFAALPQATKDEYRAIVDAWKKDNPETDLRGLDAVHEALRSAGVTENTPSIVQIKGKQNRAPNEEYLPFVQDFVKSGKWSDVGDLGNTGLLEVRQNPVAEIEKRALEKYGRYVTTQEMEELSKGFASGGEVKPQHYEHEGTRAYLVQD